MTPERISHYELVRLIGRGGMGEVHEATDLKLRRRVALKFLSPELTADAGALARFEREAHAAAELSHPHIATVYAFEPEGERPFIAMELLAGPSVRQQIDLGALPVAEALAIARDVAAALAYAHAKGIAHRDIKPENLMFDAHGKVKVMDFGLARATMASKLTLTGASLGTPAYMSPEAIRGETGPAGDVFALGLVLYEMLTGQRAYPGDNVMAVMFAIANDAPPPLHERRPDVPEAVEPLIARTLEKDPATRIDAATAAVELSALTGVPAPVLTGSFPASDASGVTRAGTGAATSSQARLSGAGASTPPPSPGRLHRSRFAVIGGGLAAAIILGGVLLWTGAGARRRDAAVELEEQGVAAGQAGRADEARAKFAEALKLDPAQPGALNNLGFMALAEQRYATAESLFNAMIEHHPNDSKIRASALHNLAECDIARKDYARAVTRLNEAFGLDSSSADAYNNLAWALIQNRQSADALTLLVRGVARFPGEAHLHKNAGVAARDLGDLRAALTHLDAAVRLDSTLHEAEELRDRTRLEIAAGRGETGR